MARIDVHSSRDEALNHGGCACGAADEALPELDVQTIPHAVRHAAIFGALESLRPGAGLILSATHDPVPLLDQLSKRCEGQFAVEYLERGPQRFRVKLVRRPSL